MADRESPQVLEERRLNMLLLQDLETHWLTWKLPALHVYYLRGIAWALVRAGWRREVEK